jgi:hypothetical protein
MCGWDRVALLESAARAIAGAGAHAEFPADVGDDFHVDFLEAFVLPGFRETGLAADARLELGSTSAITAVDLIRDAGFGLASPGHIYKSREFRPTGTRCATRGETGPSL